MSTAFIIVWYDGEGGMESVSSFWWEEGISSVRSPNINTRPFLAHEGFLPAHCRMDDKGFDFFFSGGWGREKSCPRYMKWRGVKALPFTFKRVPRGIAN